MEGIYLEENNGPNLINARITREDRTRIAATALSLEEVLARRASELPRPCFVVDQNLLEKRQTISDVVPDEQLIVIAAGEQHKSTSMLLALTDELVRRETSRTDALVSVGGGVVSDITGLLANLYFRGIRVEHIPTTLLGMVDAAVGGKVAVNHESQKNLIGSFYHPSAVTICTDSLETCSDDVTRAAFGEILKIAMVDGSGLFEILVASSATNRSEPGWLQKVVMHCIASKLHLLGANCFERDLKRTLNFGHTIAHPIEDYTGFAISHGDAVSIGIAVASTVARRRGAIDAETCAKIQLLQEHLDLPTQVPAGFVERAPGFLSRLLLQRGGKSLHYVIPTSIKHVKVVDEITSREIESAIVEMSKNDIALLHSN